jgi:hypothetical protein
MIQSIITIIGVSLILGIIITNPNGASTELNSLTSGATGIINSLEVKGKSG